MNKKMREIYSKIEQLRNKAIECQSNGEFSKGLEVMSECELLQKEYEVEKKDLN